MRGEAPLTTLKFLHVADLHLGSPFSGLSEVPHELAEQLRNSGAQILKRLASIAIAEQVDFVLFAGDQYDRAQPGLRELQQLKETLSQITTAGISCYLVHGNHDPAAAFRQAVKWPENVYWFPPGKIESMLFQRDGEPLAEIVGYSYNDRAVRENVAIQFKNANRAPWAIGLLHANVEQQSQHANYAPCSISDLNHTGIDYWALGHVHQHRVIQKRPYIVYPGCAQGRHPQEYGVKGAVLTELRTGGFGEIKFMPLAEIQWDRISIDMEELDQEDLLAERLQASLTTYIESSKSKLVAIRLHGRTRLHGRLITSEGKEEWLAFLQDMARELHKTSDYDAMVWPYRMLIETSPRGESDWKSMVASDHMFAEADQISSSWQANEEKWGQLLEQAVSPLRRQAILRQRIKAIAAQPSKKMLRRMQQRAVDLWMEEGD